MLLVIAVASTLVALVMSVMAWRLARAERARSAARVEALARAIEGESVPAFDLKIRPAERLGAGRQDESAPTLRPQPVLTMPPRDAVGSRLGLSLAAGAFVVTTAAAAAIVFSSESPTASANPASAPRQAAGAATSPLELVSLDHERDADTLVVRGVVRNPTGGLKVDDLVVIVSTVGFDGRVLASTRAAVDSNALVPGGQSSFSVSILRAGDVGRYRVSFRSGDRVVPHVDKRIRS